MSYHANGNMTSDALNTLTYDGENRLATNAQAGVTSAYSYDGGGLRVKKQVGSATATVYVFSGAKVIAEYAAGAAAASPQREYLYSGSQLLATMEGGATKYHLNDHLSARVTTDATGNKIGEQGHYPFGESWYATNTTTKWQFTSYERDAESGNDYAMARYDVNRLGRFSSPDPLSGDLANPQSLNRYSYVLNDPINLIDPMGLHWECIWAFIGGRPVPPTCTWVTDKSGGSSGGGGGLPGSGPGGGAGGGGTSGGGGGREGRGGGGQGGGPGGPGGGMDAARKLLMKNKCVEFLATVALGAAFIVNNNQPPNADEFNFLLQNAGFAGLTRTLDNATFSSSSSTPQAGQFITIAQAFPATQSITLYAPYFSQSQTGQGQTLIHEAVHLLFGFSDQQLGTAATGQPFGSSEIARARASAAFQEQLKKNCK